MMAIDPVCIQCSFFLQVYPLSFKLVFCIKAPPPSL